MIKNYLMVVLRSMGRNKIYAVINILGLAVGMTATILILLFVKDELSYDRYHDNHERVYRVTREWLNEDGKTNLHLGHVAPPFGPLLKNDFEGTVQESVRFLSGYEPLMVRDDRKFEESYFFFTEANVFRIFSWEMIQGDPESALADPFSIVITESMALKYFGEEDPMEKELVFNNFGISQALKVTGVIRDIPENSHFQVNMLASFKLVENYFGADQMMQNWGSNNYATYLLLPEDYDIKDLEAQIPDFIDRHLGQTNEGNPMSETNKLHFMPLADIHLHSHLDSEIEPNGDIAFVYLFLIIAIFTMIIACINFMNLTTAKSTTRSKEVGLRKVLGALRGGLVRQFIAESIVYSFIGLLISVLLVNLFLPLFNDFIQKDISFNILENTGILWILAGVMVLVGFISGSYPAFYLSSFQPAAIIRKSFQSKRSKVNLRSILVVFQFTLSIGLIIGVGVVQDQIEFMRSKPLGFNKENIMSLPMSQQIYDEYENVRARLLQQEGIENVALGSRIPSGRLLDSQGMSVEVNGEMKPINFRVADVHTDHNYLDLIEVDFMAGRDFDDKLASDSTGAFIINESTVYQVGWNSAEEAIGSVISYGGQRGSIIGVVKNFHFESLHQSISPIIFMVTNGRYGNIMVKYDPEHKKSVEEYLKTQWADLRPDYPFDYAEVNDQFSEQYDEEDRVADLGKAFSWLAIFIAALGLYGLASFITEQRQKEIGIRKVLGASVNGIVVLLTRNFTVLVLIALLLATPLMYWLMTKWLDQFAYAGAIQWLPFLYAGVFALFIAWVTVGYQTIKAAVANPVDSIRDE
jgi:putative ABC transport system permease protein